MNTLLVQTRIERDPADPRPYFLSDLLVDGESIVNLKHDGLGIDLVALARSVKQGGEFFIITCSCGDAGCAGIDEGIEVIHDSDEVRWVVRGFSPDRAYVFEKAAYATSIKQGLDHFLQLLFENPSIEPVPRTNEYLATYLAQNA
jgi:hypothetical protein